MTPVTIGVAGLGGYARSVAQVLLALNDEPNPSMRFVAACDPFLSQHAERVAEFEAAGIRLFDDYMKMLAEPIDAVWLPVPIHLHRPFTEQALAAGKAVLCEKPVAGCVDDLDAMIAARDKAKLPVAIGFHDMAHPTTAAIKHEILNGGIGKVKRASVVACWPRGENYFARNNWAGQFRHGDTWVMDSPANNAMAHYINLALFFLGDDFHAAAQPTAVEAELYRVKPIENYDTVSMRITLASGATLLVLMTHACDETVNPVIVIEGTAGVIRREVQQAALSVDGKVKTTWPIDDPRGLLARRFAQMVRGEMRPADTIATLETSRPHLVAVNGASQTAAIVDVPTHAITNASEGRHFNSGIPNIEQAVVQCAQRDTMLHTSGLYDWTRQAGRMDLVGYTHFAGPRTTTPAASHG